MGSLIDGVWQTRLPKKDDGQFKRSESRFRDRVTADGSSGFKAEAGRYHLYAAYSCPWAHRALIYLTVKGLSSAITVSHAIPGPRPDGWRFAEDARFPDCVPDQINDFDLLQKAYVATDPNFTGTVTVPVLWDKKTSRIVNNESSEIIRMLNSEFNHLTGNVKDFYPAELRPEIDALNDTIYRYVNNGVYRCGFATTQDAYDVAFDELFDTLDYLEGRLAGQRYLIGDVITEADWRLFPTLVRFDVAYFSVFKCNKKRIADYPNLSRYMNALYQVPGIADTVKPRYYVIGYYSNPSANPNGIIPRGTPASLGLT